jgi:hypothetical protein
MCLPSQVTSSTVSKKALRKNPQLLLRRRTKKREQIQTHQEKTNKRLKVRKSVPLLKSKLSVLLS